MVTSPVTAASLTASMIGVLALVGLVVAAAVGVVIAHLVVQRGGPAVPRRERDPR